MSIFEKTVTVILGFCALAMTAMVARREFWPPDTRPRPQEIKDWRDYASGKKLMGSPNAPVTIVEFSDFQCPFCAVSSAAMKEVIARYRGKVSYVFRSAPNVQIHPHARNAALAAECAATQGRFEQLHGYLFDRQDSIGTTAWRDIALRTGVPRVEEFEACLKSPNAAAEVARDSIAAVRLGVRGTPTILVNNLLLPAGAYPADSLLKLISAEMEHSRR